MISKQQRKSLKIKIHWIKNFEESPTSLGLLRTTQSSNVYYLLYSVQELPLAARYNYWFYKSNNLIFSLLWFGWNKTKLRIKSNQKICK